jgi:predicted enzyme related to lactoylglutathione lyase
MAVTGTKIIHYVEDMTRALRFYVEALDFEVVSKSDDWSTLKVCEGWELGLHSGSPAADKFGRQHPYDALNTELSLTVDDLAGHLPRVTALGGEVVRTIEATSYLPIRMILIRDPEGNGLQLNQFVAVA